MKWSELEQSEKLKSHLQFMSFSDISGEENRSKESPAGENQIDKGAFNPSDSVSQYPQS